MRSGNSGGPLIDPSGRVLGTVFATTTFGDPGRLRDPQRGRPDAPSTRLGAEVDTGPLHRLTESDGLHFRAVNSLPPEVERRRRLLTRTLPLALIALVAFAGRRRAGQRRARPKKDAAERFAAAWERQGLRRDVPGAEPESRSSAISIDELRRSPTATRRRWRPCARSTPTRPATPPSGDGATVVPVEIEAHTAAFGPIEAELELPLRRRRHRLAPEALVFPGLRRGEQLENEIELAPRAPILAADGSPLAEGDAEAREHPLGSSAIDITGEVGTAEEEDLPELERRGFPADTPVGVSGLEQAFNSRLAGRPGGSLLAVSEAGGSARILARAEPRPGAPVKTTIDPGLQEAAVSALAGRSGGIAVLDTRNGDVRALAGQAFSAPQPPGSTFKMITTTAALQKDVVSLDDYFEITDGVNVGGRFIDNANGEFCGGTFREAFAESCNADFAPLGPEIGNDELVEAAERFGFNSPPDPLRAEIVAEVEPPESTIPTEIGDELDLGVTAIGQGEVLATPLQMASVAQTIANGGVRAARPRSSPTASCAPRPSRCA